MWPYDFGHLIKVQFLIVLVVAKAAINAWMHRYNTATYIRPLKDKWELCIIGVGMKPHEAA